MNIIFKRGRRGVQVECLAANLIARRLAKGYLSHEHKILVVLKGGVAKAFPPIEPGMI